MEKLLRNESIYEQKVISEQTPISREKSVEKYREQTSSDMTFFSDLPIHRYVDEIIEKVTSNKVTIICGDTGCGKTTQVPQILYNQFKKIIVALPKKVSAISIAQRVAMEMGVKLGEEVGYRVRWDEKYSKKTKILFVTDGILSLECLNGNIKNYDLIIIDELHERKMDYDFILSYYLVKELQSTLLFMSATINIEHFKKLFNAATVSVPVRTFPNTIYYLNESNFDVGKDIIATISKICQRYQNGDILVFLPGINEIERVNRQIKDTIISDVEIVKLSGAFSTKYQMKIFEKIDKRKIILATNIAESSVTVNDLVFVIDSGQAKRNIIRNGAESLETLKISKSSADQRAGRVGRICPGHVYRMYTKSDLSIFKQDLEPETVCGDITSLVLKFLRAGLDFTSCMKLMGYKNVRFYKDTCMKLLSLKCINTWGELTDLGEEIAAIPLSIERSRTILKAIELGLFYEVAMICSILEVDRVFFDDKRFVDSIDDLMKQKSDGRGDHFSYLNLFIEARRENFSQDFCQSNYLKPAAMKEARQVFNQLVRRFAKDVPPFKLKDLRKKNYRDRIELAFCHGFKLNIAKKCKGHYSKLNDNHLKLQIAKSSSLLNERPELILYDKLILTTKYVMRDCMRISESTLKLMAENDDQ